ncbi:MAG: DEAD/DEAH box helicase [Caulobacter sp.]|nr:DEAD/DEAH box helicase [Caulobacter sp.]
MKPNAAAINVLSTTRSKAKMYEFRIPEESHIAIPRDPGILFSLAIGILGDVAAELADRFDPADPLAPLTLQAPDIWDEDEPDALGSLRFTATFFDAYLNSRLNEEISTEFSLFCACAYYLAGNVGSAAVIGRHINGADPIFGLSLARLTYQILRNDYSPLADDIACNDIITAMRMFFSLETGASGVADACENVREQVYEAGAPREVLYIDLVTALCALKVRAASRTVIPVASNLSLETWRPAILKAHFPAELWPAQLRICDEGLLQGASAVVQMPTSAGKTRATELIIRSAFLSGRTQLAVIVAPFRSLCHDIRTDLSEAFANENISLNEATDSYQLDIAFDDEITPTVLIVTPEKLLYLLRRTPELSDQIGLVIYDEGHQFDGMARGPTYELLLSTLRMSLGADAQVILISAVIGNASQISEWLIGRDHVVGGEGILPTAKSIAFASWQEQRGRLEYVSPVDPDEQEFFVPRVIEQIQLVLKPRETAERPFPREQGGDVGLYLGLRVVHNGSVALFCGRKSTAANLCGRAAEIFERQAPYPRPAEIADGDEIAKLASLTATELGAASDAARAAQLGILAHHGDTPQGIRLAIEHAMRQGLANFVVCTSTLAQGVNLPIKYLIVTATQQGRERILVRDFHNLIGRAGRAGMHTEGSVIFAAPEIYDERRQNRFRWAAARQLLDYSAAEPVHSAILRIFDDYTQFQPPIVMPVRRSWLNLTFADRAAVERIIDEAVAIDANVSRKDFGEYIEVRARAVQNIAAYLAAHMTFDAEEGVERVEQLAANTLAYHLADDDTRPKLLMIFRDIAVALQENADDALRILIRKSPLPPRTIAGMQAWLVEHQATLLEAMEANRLLDALAEFSLGLTEAPTIRKLRLHDDHPTAIRDALILWVRGTAYAEILALLEGAGVKKGRNTLKVENVVGLCENGFGYDLAMVIASMADLAEDIDPILFDGLGKLQKSVKYGLPSVSSQSFFEVGFADRVIAQALAEAIVMGAGDKLTAKLMVRGSDAQAVDAVLEQFPSYFQTVAAELRR